MNLLDALYFIKTAWNQVTNTYIKNSFGKAFQRENQCLREDQTDLLAEIYRKNVPLEMSHQDLEEFFNIDLNLSEEPI